MTTELGDSRHLRDQVPNQCVRRRNLIVCVLQAKLCRVLYMRLSLRLGRNFLCTDRNYTRPNCQYNQPNDHYAVVYTTDWTSD